MFVTLACRACDVASITVPYLYIQNRSGSCPRPLLTWTIEDKSYIMCVLWTKKETVYLSASLLSWAMLANNLSDYM